MSDNGSGSDGGSGGGSGGGSNIREDIVASAVRFLTDPKVKGSSLAKKVSFLETKGLTAQEIDAALKQANNGEPLSTNLTQGSNSGQPAATSTDSEATTTSSLSPAQQHYRPQQQQQAAYGQHQMVAAAPPPVPPPRPSMDWKDYFIAAVVAGGVGYGLYVVIKSERGEKLWIARTLNTAPLLTISEEREAWKEERALMKEQNEETRQRLAKLEEGTENALEAIQGNSLKIQTAIDRMVELLEKLSRDQERRDTAMGRLESRLDSVQAKLTSEASGSSNGQGPSISDLQSDIRSLKSLLLSRRVPASTTGVSAATLNPA
ncbi:peroxisomal membrane protein pex14, partial [Spiromyces aspiralis]